MGRIIVVDNIFDQIILSLNGKRMIRSLNELHDLTSGKSMLSSEEISEKIRRYRARYRRIYDAFRSGKDLDELNRELDRPLYARDLVEATMIYSFKKHLSFSDWKKLIGQLEQLEKEGAYDDLLISGYKGGYKAFPLSKVMNYVKRVSLLSEDKVYTVRNYTLQKTRTVEENLGEISEDPEFVAYISENIRTFSEGREKARYYICKYFLLYLNTKIVDYMACGYRSEKRNRYLELPLSNISYMDPNRHANLTKEEITQCLVDAKISSNKLFDLVNSFYMLVFQEREGSEDPYYMMSGVLRGQTVSRELLLLLLLFFSTEADIPDAGMQITKERLDDILNACRFDKLDPGSRILDAFIVKVICSDDRRSAIRMELEQYIDATYFSI